MAGVEEPAQTRDVGARGMPNQQLGLQVFDPGSELSCSMITAHLMNRLLWPAGLAAFTTKERF